MPASPPAVLWALFRGGKPSFDAAAVQAALGDGARVTPAGGVLSVCLGPRELHVLPVGVPLTKALVGECLAVAHLAPDQKAQLAEHGAHALVVHQGEAPPGADGLVALYRTAWALHHDDDAMLGVINPVTWMCLTTDMLGETMKPEFVEAVRASPAESLALWLGFVKLFRPDGATWVVTRGAWLVGLPDLAWLAQPDEDLEPVHSMFASILDYASSSGTRLAVGHTIDFAERPLCIRAPYEYIDYVGEKTLVLEPRPTAPRLPSPRPP